MLGPKRCEHDVSVQSGAFVVDVVQDALVKGIADVEPF
jgi:hypothetical protein